VRGTFWYFVLVFSLHVPQVPANSYVSLILALAGAMIEGLTLSFFLILFTSFFFPLPLAPRDSVSLLHLHSSYFRCISICFVCFCYFCQLVSSLPSLDQLCYFKCAWVIKA
jgi:hypothetical protein